MSGMTMMVMDLPCTVVGEFLTAEATDASLAVNTCLFPSDHNSLCEADLLAQYIAVFCSVNVSKKRKEIL